MNRFTKLSIRTKKDRILEGVGEDGGEEDTVLSIDKVERYRILYRDQALC